MFPDAPSTTVILLQHGFFATETMNRVVEQYYCMNSGRDLDITGRQFDMITSAWLSQNMDGVDPFELPDSYWDASPQPQWQPRVVEVVDVTPEDLSQWLAGPDLTDTHAQQIAAVGTKFGPAGPAELDEIIRLVRSVRATRADADFRNPFAIIGLGNSAARMIFGDKLEFGALLNTQECRFLLDNWKDGYRFDEVCDVLDAACGNIETAGELLYT
jgi:hypothetical protein